MTDADILTGQDVNTGAVPASSVADADIAAGDTVPVAIQRY